jgi:hypothetical protein
VKEKMQDITEEFLQENQAQLQKAAELKQLENEVSSFDTMTSLGLKKIGHDYYNSFNKYRNLEGQDFLESGFAYIFFTKPQLNLTDQDESMLKKYNPFIYSYTNSTTYVGNFSGGGFVYGLTSLATNFDTHDTVLETDEYNETFRGYKMVAPTTSVKSRISGDFSINYLETSDMFITTYHKIWMDYIEGVREGTLSPSQDAIKGYSKSTFKSKVGYIDYMNSAYYFLLEPDNKTIKYYAKYTGIFPTNVPFSSFKWEAGSTEKIKMNINYTYNFKEDLNPVILDEFNIISSFSGDLNNITISSDKLVDTWNKRVLVKTHVDVQGYKRHQLLFGN